MTGPPDRGIRDGYCWRSGCIGIGMPYLVAPTPTPPSHVFGGTVPTPRVDGFSAAQNM